MSAAIPMAMSPEMTKRAASAVMGGASTTMIRAEVKAEDHMRAKTSPMTIARMSMMILRDGPLARFGDPIPMTGRHNPGYAARREVL